MQYISRTILYVAVSVLLTPHVVWTLVYTPLAWEELRWASWYSE